MLHEILLALSGHPSALFDEHKRDLTEIGIPGISPPEAELLSSVGRLAKLHRATRTHALLIASTHESTICRAVANAIASSRLARFQQKILDIESRILRRDASSVGAYNIVPLAGIVSELDEWTRLMEWYWEIINHILQIRDGKSGGGKPNSKDLSGAALIDKLRQEAQTGYPDIEEAALDLDKVAETAWLRQLTTWVLYGRLPAFGAQDFFIQAVGDQEAGPPEFISNAKLLPKFVSPVTASSILFIGKSLNHIRTHGGWQAASGDHLSRISELDLVPAHLKYLSDLSLPISSSSLSEAVSAIRHSLSRNTLQRLLPPPKIVETLTLLQEFFLLGRGEFALTLISEADKRLKSRQHTPGSQAGNLGPGAVIKEGEATSVLSNTWTVLSSFAGEEDMGDDNIDLARKLIHLTLPKPSSARPATPGRAKEGFESLPRLSNVVFNDALFSMPTTLTMDIPSPLDLFLSVSDLEVYSTINAYFLAIRRSHLHLTNLWRQSSIRRDFPSPLGPPHSCTPTGLNLLRERRARRRKRTIQMRKVWATCGAAVFLLSETHAYFEGEVVQQLWKHFIRWIQEPSCRAGSRSRPQSSSSGLHRQDDAFCAPITSVTSGISQQPNTQPPANADSPHDPETLASSHRQFLTALAHALLITDVAYTRMLRNFLTHVDELVAYISRLQVIQQNLDLEHDEGVVDAMANYEQDEKEVTLELDRARKRLDSNMKSLVGRLREIDAEHVGSGISGAKGDRIESGYEPHRIGGVDRLLMKLDFGSMVVDEVDIDEAALL